MTTAYPRLANPGDLPRLISRDDVSDTWPPPGCTVIPVAHPEPWGQISGPLESLPAGRWYVTTLAEFVLEVPSLAATIIDRAAANFGGPVGTFAGVVGAWPVIYSVGEGNTMRWIHTTLRGTLGGVEQFQMQANFGQPGADPDLDAAGAQAFAQSLAEKWQAVWLNTGFGTGGLAYETLFPSAVKYTEVGVCVQTQTSGTAADGSGGNLAQEDPTEWAPINGIAGVVGTNANPSLPFEVACCVTLQTDHRGPSGRGRMYIPPMATQAMGSNGVFSGYQAIANGKAIGAYFAAVTADEGYVPVVVSRRRIILNEVKQISVGVVPDSQRRRRWAQLEAPTVAWTKP